MPTKPQRLLHALPRSITTSLVFTLCFAVLTTGCANLSSIHREFNVDYGEGALIDVKQRAIFVSKQKRGGDTEAHSIVCAEPSPDSMSAYAAQLAAEGKTPQGVSGSMTGSAQESAAFIGMRTQSIQILRDEMYRNCEAYMSGAIDRDEYDILMRRSQKYMVALIGIEQLTGVVKVPPVVINTSGSASASNSIRDMRDDVKANGDKIKKLEADKAALSDADQKGDKGKKIDAEIAAIKVDNNDLEAAIKNAKGLATSGSATSVVYVNDVSSRSGADIQAVAEKVSAIVLDVVNTDDAGQLCFAKLAHGDINGKDKPIADYCLRKFNSQLDTIDALNLQIKSAKTLEERSKVSDLVNQVINAEGRMRITTKPIELPRQ